MEHVIPAIIPHSTEQLLDTLDVVRGLSETVQIDVVDGHFATPPSWPYKPHGDPDELTETLQEFTVEIDLMVAEPLNAASAWHESGTKRFVFHIESVSDFEAVWAFKHASGATVGLALSNDTPLPFLTEHIAHCDFVQLMGIKEIGSQGQEFDKRVLRRITELRTNYPDIVISIDGSVNEQTIPQLHAAGAHRFVVGSAILNAEDPKESYRRLSESISH